MPRRHPADNRATVHNRDAFAVPEVKVRRQNTAAIGLRGCPFSQFRFEGNYPGGRFGESTYASPEIHHGHNAPRRLSFADKELLRIRG